MFVYEKKLQYPIRIKNSKTRGMPKVLKHFAIFTSYCNFHRSFSLEFYSLNRHFTGNTVTTDSAPKQYCRS